MIIFKYFINIKLDQSKRYSKHLNRLKNLKKQKLTLKSKYFYTLYQLRTNLFVWKLSQ